MAPLSQTLVLDTIGAITNAKISEKIADNISRKIPVFYFLNKMGHKEYENGGYDYRLPIFYQMANAQAYTGNTVLDTAENDPVTACVFNRKQISVPIEITGTKLLQNGGGNFEAIVPYLTTMVETAEESMKDALAGSSIGIMSSQGDGDLGITGLQTMLTSDNTTGTYGQLSRATYTMWRQQTDTVATGFNTDGLSGMRRVLFTASRGDEVSTLVTMTVLGFTNLVRSLTGTIQYDGIQGNSPMTKVGDVDFQTINFHGATVVMDSNQPTNTAYFLNLKYCKLMVHSERDMTVRDFISPYNQDSMIGRLLWAGNLVCNNLGRQGRLGGLIETWA